MDSFAAMALGEAARRSGAKQRVFDWDRAASLIDPAHEPSIETRTSTRFILRLIGKVA